MAAIPKMNWILLKFYLYASMGGMLKNSTSREILSNMIPNFTYSTNERERERERDRQTDKKSRCLWEEKF